MKICPNCGHENNDTGKFCEECGTKLVEPPKFCPECGTKLEGAPKFCPECGCNLATGVALQDYNSDSEMESYDSDTNDIVEYEESTQLSVQEDDEDYEEYVDEDEYEDTETTEDKLKKIVDKYLPIINKSNAFYRSRAVQNTEYSQVFQNVRSYIAKDVSQSEIIGYIDDTAFGEGKTGLVFTTNAIYSRVAPFKSQKIPYTMLGGMYIKGGSLNFPETAGKKITELEKSILNSYNLPALKDCLEEIREIL